jgi:hypothetical protein
MKLTYGTRRYDPRKIRLGKRKFSGYRMGKHATWAVELVRWWDQSFRGKSKAANYYLHRYMGNPLYAKGAIQYMFGSFYRAIFGLINFAGDRRDYAARRIAADTETDKNLTEDLGKYLIDLERRGEYFVRGAVARQKAGLQFRGRRWESRGHVRPEPTHLKRQWWEKFTAASNRMMWIRFDKEAGIADIEFWDHENWAYRLVQVTAEEFHAKIVPNIQFFPSTVWHDVGKRV